MPTVDDNRMFDSHTLYEFLKDKDYWGNKRDDFLGVIGNFAWNEEWASTLTEEYVNLCEILIYYKKR